MSNDNQFLVGSFSYKNEEASGKALKEQAKIMKLESQLDYNNPSVVYSLYCKIINSKLLETLEGVTYLLHLQNYLYENEGLLPAAIPAIPAEILEKSGIINQLDSHDKVDNEQINKEQADKEQADKEQADKEQADNQENDNSEEDKNKLTRSEAILKKQRAELMKKNKTDIIIYKIIIAFLIVLVVVMLAIAFKSDSPNIVNYRSKIQNEYADWENQLKQKEKELNEREKELNK